MKTTLKAILEKQDIKKAIMEDIQAWKGVDEEDIVNDLVKEFGEDAREEIQDSLSLKSDLANAEYRAVGRFEADRTGYVLMKNEDVAEMVAEDQVRDDLQSEPELFNKDFLKSHYYVTDTDARLLGLEMAKNDMEGMDDALILDMADKTDKYEETTNDKEKERILNDAREEIESDRADEYEEAIKKDPIEFLVNDQGLYSEEDIYDQNFMSIDVNEAAKEAVSTDGWAHFLSRENGNYETTGKGFVYFKES